MNLYPLAIISLSSSLSSPKHPLIYCLYRLALSGCFRYMKSHDIYHFVVCLLSCSMFSRFIHVTACIVNFIPFFMAKQSCIVWIYDIFTHSSVDTFLRCFHILAIMSVSAVNIHVQVFGWAYVFILEGYIHRNEINGSHDNSTFNHLSSC